MTERYYTEGQGARRSPRTWQTTLRGKRFTFTTDDGVFSKGRIDLGTRLLIEAFVFPEEIGAILDVGCGYGPIGLTIAKCDASREVVMLDVNERALQLASINAEENGISNVKIMKSDLFTEVADREFAAILSNPPIRAGKRVVYQLFESAYEQLKENGVFWTVIQKKQGAPSAKKQLAALFSHVDVIQKKKGYYIFACKK